MGRSSAPVLFLGDRSSCCSSAARRGLGVPALSGSFGKGTRRFGERGAGVERESRWLRSRSVYMCRADSRGLAPSTEKAHCTRRSQPTRPSRARGVAVVTVTVARDSLGYGAFLSRVDLTCAGDRGARSARGGRRALAAASRVARNARRPDVQSEIEASLVFVVGNFESVVETSGGDERDRELRTRAFECPLALSEDSSMICDQRAETKEARPSIFERHERRASRYCRRTQVARSVLRAALVSGGGGQRPTTVSVEDSYVDSLRVGETRIVARVYDGECSGKPNRRPVRVG